MRPRLRRSERQLSVLGVRFVAVKTEDQQAMFALHRVRHQFVRFLVIQVTSLGVCRI